MSEKPASSPYREPTQREAETARIIVVRIGTAFGREVGDDAARERGEWVVAGFPWTRHAAYEYPLHGKCEPRSQGERRAALVADVAAALHRNVCDPNHEELGPWDTDRAEEMVAHFEQAMADDD